LKSDFIIPSFDFNDEMNEQMKIYRLSVRRMCGAAYCIGIGEKWSSASSIFSLALSGVYGVYQGYQAQKIRPFFII
jgi:hypothetical protein